MCQSKENVPGDPVWLPRFNNTDYQRAYQTLGPSGHCINGNSNSNNNSSYSHSSTGNDCPYSCVGVSPTDNGNLSSSSSATNAVLVYDRKPDQHVPKDTISSKQGESTLIV